MAPTRYDPKLRRSGLTALLSMGLLFNGMNTAMAGDRPSVPFPRNQAAAMERHLTLKAQFPDAADIVLLGDSMIQRWSAPDIAAAFPHRRVLNLGVGGDRTQNLLWRLQDLPLETLSPQTVIILVGTNNLTDSDKSADIVGAIRLIVAKARKAWPAARIYVSAILPRGKDFAFRAGERETINRDLRLHAARDGYQFVAVNEPALTCPHAAAENFRPDKLHLAPAGYRILGESIGAALRGQPSGSGPCRTD